MIYHKSPISGVSVFSDEYVSTAGYDNQVILWDAKTGDAIARGWHDHLANQCAFSKCGKFLVSAGSDYSARIWTVPEMKLHAVCNGHQDDVEMAEFHPTHPFVATCSRDKEIRIFDIYGTLLRKITGHCNDVIAISWLGDSMQLASSSDDGTVKIWNADNGDLIRDINFGGIETDTIAFSPSGVIFAGNDAGEIISINGDENLSTNAHEAGIKRIAYSKEYELLVSLSYDRTIKLWNASADGMLTLISSTDIPPVVWPRSVSIADQNRLVCGTFGTSYATYYINEDKWDASSVKPTFGINSLAEINGSIYSVGDAGFVYKDKEKIAAFGSLCNFLVADENIILTGGQAGEILSVKNQEMIHQHRSPLNCGTFYKQDEKRFFLIGTYTGEVILLEAIGNDRLDYHSTHKILDNAIKGICVFDDYLFAVDANGAAAIISIKDFDNIKLIESAHRKIANGCTSVNGIGVATVSRDMSLRLIDSEGNIEEFPSPHRHSIKCVAASKDGHYIVTGSYHGSCAVFDVHARRWLNKKRLTTAGISSLTYSKHFRCFLASSYDGQVYRLEIPNY
ncbi:WD40 repeat domain-containing protein [Nitrincola sp. MINF-07-Sa-05]|uniref:WD40 repeat domain-containing protein n=1 Tax=Nitrincola salilacus TaxID=3400273 RepID=UPI0039184C12